ncbi:MAG: hypothetical protein RLZZ385_1222 [Pseudomonadota bacterium]
MALPARQTSVALLLSLVVIAAFVLLVQGGPPPRQDAADVAPGQFLPINDPTLFAPATQPVTTTELPVSAPQPVTVPLQELFAFSAPPTSLTDQLAREVDSIYGEFLATLDAASGQRDGVRDALIASLEAQRGGADLQNPWQQATALANWLSADELATLAETRQQQAFARFVQVQEPQLLLLAPQLDTATRQQVLGVLFAEMPSLDGDFSLASGTVTAAGAPSLPDYLQAQRDAVDRARQILNNTLAPDVIRQVEPYLQSLTAGVDTAARIFSN